MFPSKKTLANIAASNAGRKSASRVVRHRPSKEVNRLRLVLEAEKRLRALEEILTPIEADHLAVKLLRRRRIPELKKQLKDIDSQLEKIIKKLGKIRKKQGSKKAEALLKAEYVLEEKRRALTLYLNLIKGMH